MNEFAQPDTGDPQKMTSQQASRLLKIGLSGETRPVDELIDRLQQTDGVTWLSKVLTSQGLNEPSSSMRADGDPPPSLDRLVAMKELSKKLLHQGGSEDRRLSATASYFFSVGAALAYHKKIICSRDRKELDPILKDLAAAAPDPWSSMFERAVASPA